MNYCIVKTKYDEIADRYRPDDSLSGPHSSDFTYDTFLGTNDTFEIVYVHYNDVPKTDEDKQKRLRKKVKNMGAVLVFFTTLEDRMKGKFIDDSIIVYTWQELRGHLSDPRDIVAKSDPYYLAAISTLGEAYLLSHWQVGEEEGSALERPKLELIKDQHIVECLEKLGEDNPTEMPGWWLAALDDVDGSEKNALEKVRDEMDLDNIDAVPESLRTLISRIFGTHPIDDVNLVAEAFNKAESQVRKQVRADDADH